MTELQQWKVSEAFPERSRKQNMRHVNMRRIGIIQIRLGDIGTNKNKLAREKFGKRI